MQSQLCSNYLIYPFQSAHCKFQSIDSAFLDIHNDHEVYGQEYIYHRVTALGRFNLAAALEILETIHLSCIISQHRFESFWSCTE